MPTTTPADLLDAIVGHGLLDPKETAAVPGLQARCRDLPTLTTELRSRGWLTDYQLERLQQGAGSELVLGSYVLLEPIGAGGMGQVFKARHQLMRRVVALKLIRPELVSHPLAVARFCHEIQLVAQLQHPNIVLAYDAQEHAGRHFLVMEYCPGSNLRRVVRTHGPLPVGCCCQLIRQAALGLQHAHEHGLIHRDVKPDNLLLTTPASGGRKSPDNVALPDGPELSGDLRPPVAGVVKILDFGLARLLEPAEGTETPFAQAGLVCGTPDFVAPEQAVAPQSADIRSDLYSLGCTFYFLLTGQTPFPGGSAVEKILRHRLNEPIPLAHHRPEVPVAVGAIVERLMRKDPEQRFQTPIELAGALEELALPVEPLPWPAVAEGPIEESARTTATATLGAPSLPRKLAAQAPAETAVASGTPGSRRTKGPRLVAAVAGLILVGGMVLGAVALLQRDVPSSPPAAVKPPAPISGDPATWRLLHTLAPHVNTPLSVAFSHDSKLLAVGCGSWPGHGAGGCINVWDTATGTERATLEDGRDVLCVAFAPDGKTLASSHWDHAAPDGNPEIVLWDTANWVRHASLPVAPRRVTSLAFRPDGKWLALAGDQKRLSFWVLDWPKEKAPHDRTFVGLVITAVSYSPDGRILASAGRRLPVHLFSLETGYGVFKTLPGGVLRSEEDARLTFSPDGKRLAAVTSNGLMPAEWRVWELQDYQLIGSRQHPRNFSACAFTADGSRLITADSQALLCWAVDRATEPVTVARAPDGFCSVAVSPNGFLLAASAARERVEVWRIGTPAAAESAP
jgi:serine/threonine-protein kinase